MKRDGFLAPALWIAVGFGLAAAGGSATAADGPPKGLVLHYSFDQPDASGAVTDLSPAHNHGKAAGAKWISEGKKGGGFEFAPAGQYIQVPKSPSLNLKQVTLALWFKTSTRDENLAAPD